MTTTNGQGSVEQRPLFTEFDVPMGKLLRRATNHFIKLEFPLLDRLDTEVSDHLAQSGQAGKGFSLGPTKIAAEGAMSHDDLLGTRVEAWACLTYDIGVQFGRGMARHFFETMDAVTHKTGNILSANGQPLSHDYILDLLERTEFEVDDDGNPKNVVLIGSPQFEKQIASLPPMTIEQEARFQAIKEKKREEQNAKRRVRTLDR